MRISAPRSRGRRPAGEYPGIRPPDGGDDIAETTGIEQLDALINRLIEADQTGTEIHPFDLARELGEIRSSLMATPTVHRGAEDLRHFRCESCGTISHGDATPQRCGRCGGTKFVNVDIEAG